MNQKEITNKAIDFFIAKRHYHIHTQTENLLVFETDERDVNLAVLAVLCCFGLIPGIAYYFFFAPKHKVTISMTGNKKVVPTITYVGSTKSKNDAESFEKLIT